MHRNLNKRSKILEPDTIVSSITESILRVLTCTRDKKLIEDSCQSLEVSNPADVKLKISFLLWQILNKTQGIPNPVELAYNSSPASAHSCRIDASEYILAEEPPTSNMLQEILPIELPSQETELKSEESDSEILSQLELSVSNLNGVLGSECQNLATSTPHHKRESDVTLCDMTSQDSCSQILRAFEKSEDSLDSSSLFDLSLPSASCSSYTDSSVQFSSLDCMEYSYEEAQSNEAAAERSKCDLKTIREASVSIYAHVSDMITSSVQKSSIFEAEIFSETAKSSNEDGILCGGNCDLSSPNPSDSPFQMDGAT